MREEQRMEHEAAPPIDAASLESTGGPDPFRTALQTLSRVPMAPPPPVAELPCVPDAKPFDLCAPINKAVGPQFIIPFRRPLLHPALSVRVTVGSDLPIDPGGPPRLRYNCAGVTGLLLSLVADLRL